jgi:hypothetical protein
MPAPAAGASPVAPAQAATEPALEEAEPALAAAKLGAPVLTAAEPPRCFTPTRRQVPGTWLWTGLAVGTGG